MGYDRDRGMPQKSGTVPRGAVRTAGFCGFEDEHGISKSTADSSGAGEFPKSCTVLLWVVKTIVRKQDLVGRNLTRKGAWQFDSQRRLVCLVQSSMGEESGIELRTRGEWAVHHLWRMMHHLWRTRGEWAVHHLWRMMSELYLNFVEILSKLCLINV